MLYKYFPPERRAFLDELLIRFTPPGLFNDLFDSFPAFSGFDESLIREKVNKVGLDIALNIAFEPSSEDERLTKLNLLTKANAILKKQYLSDPARLDETFAYLHRKRINSEIGVLCLCKNPKSVVMWSHYADEHKGFVVGFESEDGFFSHHPNEPEDIGVLTSVNYAKQRPYVDIRTIKEGANLPDILFTKNEEWLYEQEYRIIRFLKSADEIRDENVHLFRVPSIAVREIIFGLNSDSLTVESLQKSLKQNSKLNHIKLFTAKLSKTHYEMDIVPYE